MRRLVLFAALFAALVAIPSCAPESPAHNVKVGFFGQAIPVYGVAGSSATGIVAGAATYRSDWIDLSRYVGGVSYDVVWTGGSATPAGPLTVEVSNDDTPPALNVAATNLPLSPTPSAITGNSGRSAVDLPNTAFRWVRLVATVSAGSFTLTANAFPKHNN